MTIRVTLDFANQAEMLAFFGGNAAAAGAVVGTTSTKADKPAKEDKPAAETKAVKEEVKAKKPAHTREEMQAALVELREKVDAASAKAVISDAGGVAKMADIPDDKIDAVYEAAKAKIDEAM
jgi:hypothetical protein